MKRNTRPFCQVCGHQWVEQGRCGYCHAYSSDWFFLAQVEVLPRDRVVELACPYGTGFGASYRRCAGRIAFTIADFASSIQTGGNGPNTYQLLCRFRLQARCPVCENWYDSTPLLHRNRDALRALVEPPAVTS